MKDLLSVLALIGCGVLVWLVSARSRRGGAVLPAPMPRPSSPEQVADAVDRAEAAAEELAEPVEVTRDDVEGLTDGDGDEPDPDVLSSLRGE